MNKQIQEEIKFRKWVQSILIEEAMHQKSSSNPDILVEYMSLLLEDGVSGDPIGAFLDPFKDVLQVAKVAVKDLASIARFNFELITTLSPSKQKAARERWENRNKALESEWGKAMEPIDKIWDTSDMQLIGFMVNPAGFLGAKMAMKGLDTAEGTINLLDDAGWGIPFVTKFVRGNEAGKASGAKDDKKGSDGTVDILGTGKKLLGDLTKLFFIAHHEPAGALISEKKESAGSASDGITQYMDKMPGLEKAITKDAQEMVEAKNQHVQEIMQAFESQMKMLNGLASAADLASFIAVINAAAQEGVDIGGAGLSNFQSEIDANVKKVLSDPKARSGFIKAYLEEQGEAIPEPEEKGQEPTMPEIPDEKLVPQIEKTVFMDSKTGVQEQLFSGSENLKKQVEEEIMLGVPPENEWSIMSQTALGKSYVGVIQGAIQKIRNA